MVVCLEQAADLHMAQLMPLLLTVSCFTKIQIGFTFLVPAHLGSPGKRAVKRVCVCGNIFLVFFSVELIYKKYLTTVYVGCLIVEYVPLDRKQVLSQLLACLHGTLFLSGVLERLPSSMHRKDCCLRSS